jgi:hypothetical protein
MRLYRSQVRAVAEDIVSTLALDGDIVVDAADKTEAAQDLVSIMEEYLRQENRVVQDTRELMEHQQITYDQFGKVKGQISEQRGHPTGDEGIRWIIGQIIENFMISRYVGEVFGEDKKMRKTMMRIFRKHLVEEADLDREVRGRLKNLRPGTDKWEIEYKRLMDEVRRKRGLV